MSALHREARLQLEVGRWKLATSRQPAITAQAPLRLSPQTLNLSSLCTWGVPRWWVHIHALIHVIIHY